MKLYKIDLWTNSEWSAFMRAVYVIAENESMASEIAVNKNKEYRYLSVYAKNIELIATAGQYGKPTELISEITK